MTHSQYDAKWVKSAIPLDSLEHSKCQRYASVDGAADNQCDVSAFDRTKVITCAENELIYRTDEISIQNTVRSMQKTRSTYSYWLSNVFFSVWDRVSGECITKIVIGRYDEQRRKVFHAAIDRNFLW